jgi:hypothetical protein
MVFPKTFIVIIKVPSEYNFPPFAEVNSHLVLGACLSGALCCFSICKVF